MRLARVGHPAAVGGSGRSSRLPAGSARPCEPRRMTPLRLGLVGAGHQAAEVVVPALMSTPGLHLAAIGSSDGSAGELAETWGVEGVRAEVGEFLSVGEFDAA